MKTNHYSIFENSMDIVDWKILRNDKLETSYYLPSEKKEYLEKVDTNCSSDTAKSIISVTKKLGIKHLFSVGSGVAHLEYQVKKFSDIAVTVSDFNSSILNLKNFNIYDEVLLLDVFNDPLPISENSILFLPRIDTEFDNKTLIALFKKFYGLNIKYILFMPAQLLNIHTVYTELKIIIISILKQRKRTFCGYSRTKGEFIKIWGDYYKLVNDLKTGSRFFLLEKK